MHTKDFLKYHMFPLTLAFLVMEVFIVITDVAHKHLHLILM